jgi:hypothetical protein
VQAARWLSTCAGIPTFQVHLSNYDEVLRGMHEYVLHCIESSFVAGETAAAGP